MLIFNLGLKKCLFPRKSQIHTCSLRSRPGSSSLDIWDFFSQKNVQQCQPSFKTFQTIFRQFLWYFVLLCVCGYYENAISIAFPKLSLIVTLMKKPGTTYINVIWPHWTQLRHCSWSLDCQNMDLVCRGCSGPVAHGWGTVGIIQFLEN